MERCVRCGSWAVNHHLHGRNGDDEELCDVCYWRKRAEELSELIDNKKIKLNYNDSDFNQKEEKNYVNNRRRKQTKNI